MVLVARYKNKNYLSKLNFIMRLKKISYKNDEIKKWLIYYPDEGEEGYDVIHKN